ncbi:helix-turn-helix domain-containing protein [Vibrio natriegens]|uniref:helix-turn-helix transcriptional regulator n=1 Tax=Vibrio natriegens TaxID=691 RepID=UPI001EFC7D7D|nr:helix-turn-helix transcriptional regulator [Vibrio natriegens]MCG9699616.1 helix-turn-helix domain-containing protein [Vibrio natriegens]
MNKLKDFRCQVGATQQKIADLVDVKQGTIVRYENGERQVSINMARKLVSAFNSLGANCVFDDVFPDPEKETAQ